MAKVRKIKVIKRSSETSGAPRTKLEDARKATRQIVETVGDWVAEMHERKSNETRAAVKLLFGPAEMSES
ncbi:MAG: hypothetical protein IPM50_15015 [Acidobacteriota bacterium]|nr:MAG: hypothetical protein IPM50_15015 [Acidobacteriota bacterium]